MLLALHILAALIGIGSSSARTALFLKKGTLHPLLQKTVWVSLLILGATGFGLLFAKPTLLYDPAFLMKMFFVGALLTSEAVLARRKAVWAGLVSLFTWYFSFLWSGLERLQAGYLEIMVFYFAITFLILAIAKRYEFS